LPTGIAAATVPTTKNTGALAACLVLDSGVRAHDAEHLYELTVHPAAGLQLWQRLPVAIDAWSRAPWHRSRPPRPWTGRRRPVDGGQDSAAANGCRPTPRCRRAGRSTRRHPTARRAGAPDRRPSRPRTRSRRGASPWPASSRSGRGATCSGRCRHRTTADPA
jgi:hypothetical protein